MSCVSSALGMTPDSESLVALTMTMKRIVCFLPLLGLFEQHFQIAPEMAKALSGDLRSALGLGQDEGPLDHRLGIKTETLRAPIRIGRIAGLGFANVLGNFSGMSTDIGPAGVANGGMGFECLLHHRAKQTGEFGQGALQNCLTKIDVTQKAVKRILQSAIGSLRKQTV